MRVIPVLLMGTALLLTGGCKPASPVNDGTESNETNGTATSNSTQAASCQIESSRDWVAEAHDQAGNRVVIITGKIDVKSAGYTATLTQGALDAGPPPIQHLTLNLVTPTSQQAQQITTIDVTTTVPVAGSNEKVVVDCAGQEIAQMDVVRP